VWLLTACDAGASYGIARLIRGAPRAPQAAFLTERAHPVYRRAGYRVRPPLTDGGMEWRAASDAVCRETGVEQRRTRPRHAWTNGCVEGLQGRILTDCWRVVFRQTYFTRVEQLERAFQRDLRFYSEEQTHRGYRLEGRMPGSAFAGRVP
jgi:hypothetical protein